MAITKLLTPGSQEFHEPVVQRVKVSRGGLRGADLDAFVKRASVQFLDKMASVKPKPGEELVHLLALGATEYYGPNRNGDGFREKVCQDRHPTFQKHARWFRDHDNKDVKKGRGVIKASAYNGDMRRIELLVALNATKEAADRNGGLVADEEMEMLSQGKDIPVSMACTVSHDVCSGCGNKAAKRADYCGPELCKYGGCKDNLAKTFDDGHTLHVDNPDPTFFDISKVFRPADRIAYTLGRAKAAAAYQDMIKDACDTYGESRSGAAIAEKLGVSPPYWLLADSPWTDPRVVRQLKVANDLMQLEEQMSDSQPSPLDKVWGKDVSPLRTDTPDVRKGPFKLAHVVTALAAERCMLPLETFVALLTGEFAEKTAATTDRVAERLPGIFTRLASDPRLEEDMRTNPYLPGGPIPRRIRHWVIKHASEWSLARPRLVERLQLSALRAPGARCDRRPMMKVATADSVEELAKQYALYQIGMLQNCDDDPDAGFAKEMAIRSNWTR